MFVFATRERWLKATCVNRHCQRLSNVFMLSFFQSTEGHTACKSRAASSTANNVECPATGNETFFSLYTLQLIQALNGNQ